MRTIRVPSQATITTAMVAILGGLLVALPASPARADRDGWRGEYHHHRHHHHPERYVYERPRVYYAPPVYQPYYPPPPVYYAPPPAYYAPPIIGFGITIR